MTAPGQQVLVIGEALTDIIQTAGASKEHPGGSPANVALGLARLGVPTAFLTAIGRDERGAAIAGRLAQSGVAVLPESWSLEATSTAAAAIQDDGAAHYTFDIAWALPADVGLPAAGHVHVGSIAAFLTPGAERVEEIVAGLAPSATVSFDPNIRPALVGDPDDARTRFERLAARADVVKLSDEDAAYLYPALSVREAALAISALGARVVAVTAGAQGSLLVAGQELVEISPVVTSVADTVGAGDSYMSALLWALLAAGHPRLVPGTRDDLASAGSFAARAAAVTVSRAGAEPPTLEEVPG
ncbi:PfkB family carbohydrate kinase [Sinomonas sp. ASV322]|uniref:PfkB family carbohydrate kinase n=1 Tax=Sinomonas sp. ASV322 TaxID=3041920 RepID=UPI0027DB573F|nr:PfkB family carbohydrate kinase [Sinomonas sp. ASV322]MDQ4502556.1 PfkB family carbohydrate kinase [Sinomonas sp. ASV322]